MGKQKSKKLKKLNDFENTYMSQRKEWTINPITKIIPNKKKELLFKGYKEEY